MPKKSIDPNPETPAAPAAMTCTAPPMATDWSIEYMDPAATAPPLVAAIDDIHPAAIDPATGPTAVKPTAPRTAKTMAVPTTLAALKIPRAVEAITRRRKRTQLRQHGLPTSNV